MKLKIQLQHPNAKAPTYATEGAACFDLYAAQVDGFDNVGNAVYPGNPVLCDTGVAMEVPDGWPPVKQMHLTAAAAELRRLEAQLQKETAARQAAQIEAEALKERLVRADAEKCAAVLAERIAPKAPMQEPEIDVRNIMLAVVPGFDGMGAEVYAKSTKDVEDKLSALGSELEEWQLGIRRLPAPREHMTDGSQCWCNPETVYTDPDTGASVIIHKEPQ